ncbi:hypothetical protein BTUL_0308g00040 [Botrytis tulipae]|uniref:Rhodopsin domain-containing protein n=1 Tax=Botrytis tulipae TaxID=87230 RepID=A0A4Z1ECW4_9HELO|nr:hypothetical protein BTUL_0308g00040 [Botrytis tulipae]
MSFADIPPEELPLLPALAPPNGTVSNFINPENRADAYIVVAGIFIGLAAISVILRLYVRISLQKTPWWDDFIAVIALLTQASYTGINIWLCKHGVGKHIWDVRLINLLFVIIPVWVMADITEPLISLMKLAFLLFYYQLFSLDLIVKFAILAGIVFICVCYTTLMFLFIFLSIDKITKVNKTMAIINILTDTYILVLPIYSILKLYLPQRRKIGLALIFVIEAFDNGSAGSNGSRGTRGLKKDKYADTDDFVKLNGQSPSAAVLQLERFPRQSQALVLNYGIYMRKNWTWLEATWKLTLEIVT